MHLYFALLAEQVHNEAQYLSIRILIWIYIKEFLIIDGIFHSWLLFDNFKGQFTNRFSTKHYLFIPVGVKYCLIETP
jgi:hypothetical protein